MNITEKYVRRKYVASIFVLSPHVFAGFAQSSSENAVQYILAIPVSRENKKKAAETEQKHNRDIRKTERQRKTDQKKPTNKQSQAKS